MANFGLILLCIGLGLLLKRTKKFPPNSAQAINAFIMNVSLPAVALLDLHAIRMRRELLYPVAMPWILFGLASAFFLALRKFLGWKRQTTGALILTGGLGNTSFIGFPMLVALYGPDALKVGILTDQPGSFLVLSSLGVLVASIFSERATSLASVPGKVLRFPPFVAMLVALALHPWTYPQAVTEILEKLSATLIPLALVSVGLQMGLAPALVRKNAPQLATGLVFKLLIGPALICALYVGVMGAHGQAIQISVVQSTMAPMITGAILASDHGLDPELANLMIGVGIPLSLLSVPIWAWLLRGV